MSPSFHPVNCALKSRHLDTARLCPRSLPRPPQSRLVCSHDCVFQSLHGTCAQAPEFRPELPANSLRSKVPSSGYGKAVPTPPKKPSEPQVRWASFDSRAHQPIACLHAITAHIQARAASLEAAPGRCFVLVRQGTACFLSTDCRACDFRLSCLCAWCRLCHRAHRQPIPTRTNSVSTAIFSLARQSTSPN